jgi:hypothetical protein
MVDGVYSGTCGYAVDMTLRRKKSRKSQAADLLGNYLKVEAATKAAKGAKKAAKGTAAYKTAQKAAVVGRVPLIAAGTAAVAGTAALVVAKARGGKDEESSDEE